MKNELDLGTNLEQVTHWLEDEPDSQRPSEILNSAVKHIRRTHMSRAWTLTTADEHAINILQHALYQCA